jgi:lactoylglutathione lyase
MRLLHTMLRVKSLEESIAFYTNILGMTLLRKDEYEEGRFTLAFVGFQNESDGPVIELTYNWDVEEYELGNAFGHIAVEVDDVYIACDVIREKGGDIVRDAGPMKGSSSILAFVKDPDGYMIELLSPR